MTDRQTDRHMHTHTFIYIRKHIYMHAPGRRKGPVPDEEAAAEARSLRVVADDAEAAAGDPMPVAALPWALPPPPPVATCDVVVMFVCGGGGAWMICMSQSRHRIDMNSWG